MNTLFARARRMLRWAGTALAVTVLAMLPGAVVMLLMLSAASSVPIREHE